MSPRSFFQTKAAASSALSACTPKALRYLAALALLATPSLAQVKLSQVMGAGGNSQSPILNDYIEIYNSGAPQLLTGWSVQYASSAGATWTVTALPAITLGTGQYALVQEGLGGTVLLTQAPTLPLPDASGTIAMSATDGKVALVSSTTALVGGTPTYTANPTLVDMVGYGTLANWNDSAAAGGTFLAANNAPVPSPVNAIFRRLCGGQDTNVSKDDWAVGFVSPRNSALAATNGITGVGYALPQTLEELQTTRLVATPFRCGTLNLGLGTVVSVNASGLGAGSVAMLDDGVAPDEIAGDGIFTGNVTVAAATPVGTYNLPVSVSDGGGNTGNFYISLVVTPALTTPDNDNCLNAVSLAIPSSTFGTVDGATIESNPIVSSSGSPSAGMASTRRGVWYKVVGNGDTLVASLCGTLPVFDSVMFVLTGTCDGLSIVANDDDFCASFAASQVTWCSQLGTTYYIWVSHFDPGPKTNTFTLNITDTGVCSTPFLSPICLGVPGPYTEVEPGFGYANNDGCGSSANLFTNIA
ncbi:MAG TPA: lamin tail domain-containing protein, partial [Planctomycetota bacterium]|nr:lamin tail domain-containing protein [Planctomycetota bacterium]